MKVTKSSLDMITLMDGDLYKIGEKVQDPISEILHHTQTLSTIQKDLHEVQN